jgi:predicted RNA-binding Zn-ribbon protein involved in translation (DUF1610 family)
MEVSKILVYFACHECGRLYLTSQQSHHGRGYFDCRDCGASVHTWSGRYDFTDWRRMQ